jgi:hypothetical protein
MKPAKTILPHTVQPILTSNRYSELANLQNFSSARESLDNPGDVMSTISSSEHLNSHKASSEYEEVIIKLSSDFTSPAIIY